MGQPRQKDRKISGESHLASCSKTGGVVIHTALVRMRFTRWQSRLSCTTIPRVSSIDIGDSSKSDAGNASERM